MPMMTIHAVNSTFASVSEGEFASLDDAYQSALRAGLEIAAGEVLQGKPACTVELIIDTVEQVAALRGAITVAAAHLLSGEVGERDAEAVAA